MTAQYLTIERKERQGAGFLASLNDFTVTEGAAINADIVCTSPNVSLYCLDDTTKRAIFVELPSDTDLSKIPFVYQTQYEQARRLIAVSYDSFIHIAHDLP